VLERKDDLMPHGHEYPLEIKNANRLQLEKKQLCSSLRNRNALRRLSDLEIAIRKTNRSVRRRCENRIAQPKDASVDA
jgi:hypothetical protein